MKGYIKGRLSEKVSAIYSVKLREPRQVKLFFKLCLCRKPNQPQGEENLAFKWETGMCDI